MKTSQLLSQQVPSYYTVFMKDFNSKRTKKHIKDVIDIISGTEFSRRSEIENGRSLNAICHNRMNSIL